MDTVTILIVIAGLLAIALLVTWLAVRSRRRREAGTTMGLPSLGSLTADGLDKKVAGPTSDASVEDASSGTGRRRMDR